MVYLGVNVHAESMPASLSELSADLRATQAHLHAALVALAPHEWHRPTPSPGWTVQHQVRHLAHGEELGRLAATDPEAFGAELVRMLGDLGAVEAATTAPSGEPTDALVARWFSAAEGLRAAVGDGPPEARIGWVTGPMSKASFLTARVMETFAHGRDIATAVDREIPCTEALRHVAHLGLATRAFAYANRALPVPETSLRAELEGPAGETWSFGPDDAADVVRGSALDLCLVVTQRIHRDDTGLIASGPHAEEWLSIAQCFAGPPTEGPPRRA
jgi:uncharacterized protein (TIGR03084 family)